MSLPDFDFPPFEPARWLRDPHRMTIASRFLPRAARAFERTGQVRDVRVDDTTSVRVICNVHPGAARPTLVLVHGLASEARAPYMLSVAAKAFAAGFQTVRLNIRNCGGTAALARSHYHGGLTDEVRAVAATLVAEGTASRIHLTGFSLGGNMVLMLGAECGHTPPAWLASIGTISPCVDFEPAASMLDGPGFWYRVYRRRFLGSLKQLVRERALVDGQAVPKRCLTQAKRLKAFDARFTAPLSGFESREDYYTRASALPRIDEVRVPTLIVSSRDDPLVPFASFESEPVVANPFVRVLGTGHGGHLGFLGRSRPTTRFGCDPDRRWAENRILQFFLEIERRAGAGARLRENQAWIPRPINHNDGQHGHSRSGSQRTEERLRSGDSRQHR